MFPLTCDALGPAFIGLGPAAWPLPVPADSGAQRAQQVAADDVALNLGGSIPDALDAGITPESRKRKVAHQSHAAMNLDCPVGHSREHLRSVELCRSDLAVRRQTLIEPPRGRQSQPVCRIDFRDHVGKLERDPLEAPDRLAELMAVHCMRKGEIEGAPRTADTHRATEIRVEKSHSFASSNPRCNSPRI